MACLLIWDPVTGFYHVGSFDGGALSIVKFNDQGQLLISSINEENRTDEHIYLWDKDGTIDLVQQFVEQFSKELSFSSEFYLKASALNNHSEVIVNTFTRQPEELLFFVKSFIGLKVFLKNYFLSMVQISVSALKILMIIVT